MSPSPELDLSDYDSSASHPFTSQSHPPTTANIANNRRAQSPPLEKDEREFTQTASILQQRRRSLQAERERSASASVEPVPANDVVMDEMPPPIDETEESAARKNSETAAALFGQIDHASSFHAGFASSSPVLRPTLSLEMPPPLFKPNRINRDTDFDDDWNMKSPETIALDELDEILGGF